MHLLAWPAVAAAGRAVVGDKALNLALLARRGLPVPPGLVLPADAYDHFTVAAGLRSCYASLWTSAALVYRRRLGVQAPTMAVLIMRLVPAVAAGVAFSADPRTGRRDRVVVNAGLGLGEAVVSGQSDPDEV